MDKKPEELSSDPLRFASLIAHQLQSPLSAVGQMLQALLGEYVGPLSTRQKGVIEKAMTRCAEASGSVKRMLAIVRSQHDASGETSTSMLENVVRRVLPQFAEEASRRHMQLAARIETENTVVGMSEEACAEVVHVLLHNAFKYTPDGGQIVVRTAAHADEGSVVLSIGDSGPGVEETERERVFEPFYRAKRARESRTPGVGLGLAFVKSMVTSVGGHIRVACSDLGGAEFVMHLPRSVPASAAPRATQEPPMRVVVIGGVTGGAKAAAKILRLTPEADVTIVEKGTTTAYAGCSLPYYVSGVRHDQEHLIDSPAGLVRDSIFLHKVKNLHLRNHTEAVEIDRRGKRVRVRGVGREAEEWLPYDKLVLAMGSRPTIPPELKPDTGNVFTLQGVRNAEGIRAVLSQNQARDVVIVGGGLIGVEMTEALVAKGARVTIIEKEASILPILDADMALLVQRHLESRGVKVVTGTPVRSLEGEPRVRAVLTDTGRYAADMVILAVGVAPNVDLAAAAGLDIGETGAIATDATMRTSDPDIYAVGDCAETKHAVTGVPCNIPLGSTAMRQGRVAAVNICGGNEKFPGVVGTMICKVFDYCVGRTGLGEAEALSRGFSPISVLAPGPDRAHYVPGAARLLSKLIVDQSSRRVLGLQVVGDGFGCKRVDVAATCITAGMTVDDLANMDLGYAPPFATAIDNIMTAANVARNRLSGHFASLKPLDVWNKLRAKEPCTLLDVRSREEYEQFHLPTSVLIPLGGLRDRLTEVPVNGEIILYSELSLRAYEASLILRSAGFENVKVMEGGLAMWPYEGMA